MHAEESKACLAPQLAGRIALVTGGSRGIGAAIAERLAAAGATVAVVGRTMTTDTRRTGTLTETVGRITAAGGSAIAVQADLSDPDDRAEAVATVTRELGDVDILVNNAARSYLEPVAAISDAHYRLMFEIQVHAPCQLSQLVLPAMIARRSGAILNISSRASWHPAGPPYGDFARRGFTVYGMCKAALERLTTGLAAEVGHLGIIVNSLAPWEAVATPGTRHHDLTGATLEDVRVMAEAALLLVAGDVNGRIGYSARLLEEFGITV